LSFPKTVVFLNKYSRVFYFQVLIYDGQGSESEDDYEPELFKTSNFSLEKKNCFVVILENKLSNNWEHVLKDLYGALKPLETGDIPFKFDNM
jgi:hypothetical protein